MLSDEDWLHEIQERLADPIRSGFMARIDQQELAWCVSEITRLRAEVARLRAGRLTRKSVVTLRNLSYIELKYQALPTLQRNAHEALAELDRCYPPEEV